MFEKVNPKHPDKVADRIAGAIVDLAYTKNNNPKIAVEVLIGHKRCHIIIETSESFEWEEIHKIVKRISGITRLNLKVVSQDIHLAENQDKQIRCGDNGIFKGTVVTQEQKDLTKIASNLYDRFNSDGKYILDGDKLIICQSNAKENEIREIVPSLNQVIINPLGEWVGGTDVDTGATNRKLGSDMGDSVTGGGLHGKDLSKADVSVNIYAWLKAQKEQKTVELCCAIGDETIDNKPYSEIVEIARDYINKVGGFEKFAEWGLI